MKWYCFAIAIPILGMTGCVKNFDARDLTNKKVEGCAILRLDVNASARKTINYNAAGNPTDVLSDSGYAGYILEDYHFRYDRWGRLSDYYINYTGNIGAVIWNHYTYPDYRTVVDSIFDYVGLITDPEPPHYSFDMYMSIFKLDNKGRIVKYFNSSIPSQTPLEFADIVYDSRGNKVRPSVTYDSSVNPFQTNNVWMFIFNDFSQNNPSRDGLNAYIVYSNFDRRGLPQTLAEGFPPYATPELFNYDYNRMQIHYACDEGGGGKKW